VADGDLDGSLVTEQDANATTDFVGDVADRGVDERPRSEIAPEIVKRPRPGLRGSESLSPEMDAHRTLQRRARVRTGRAGRRRRRADLHCQHEQQTDRHHEADCDEMLISLRGHSIVPFL
jgi:hypothetical protein